ncbi:MAG: superoxide dismutase [Cu-Zn] SodC [Candidatus Berkiella sp.]
MAKHYVWQAALLITMGFCGQGFAEEKTIDVHQVSAVADNKGIGEKIGTITFKDTKKGLSLEVDLKGLTPGEHGFHLHENPSCESAEKDGKFVAALGAGGHFDPENTHSHKGPKGKGHLGDLPKLVVSKKGVATVKGVAPRLKVADLEGHSIVIHEHGDNYSDKPELGGGGARIACGVIN